MIKIIEPAMTGLEVSHEAISVDYCACLRHSSGFRTRHSDKQTDKTIAITADESVTADAEIAILEIGYHNYATTQDAAFEENVRIANKITKALLDAHIQKENIETEKLQLNRVNPEPN